MKCQFRTDGGATRIRGFHDYRPCTCEAKYHVKVIHDSYTEEYYVCGVHKNKILRREKWYHTPVEVSNLE